jgi:hypothetical protein
MADLTISSLTEQIYQARDLVAAEPTGFMQSVVVNGGSEGVSIGGTANSLRTAEPTLNTTYTPSMTIPDGDAQTLLKETLTIDKVANVRIPLTGEQQKQLDNTVGGEYARLQMFAQAFRKMRNAIEAEGGSVIKNGSSRATGTAGTSPFATNINPLSDLRKILTDNGAPLDDQISCVINTTAGADFRKLTNLYKVNEAGTGNLLRNGELGNIFGFSVKESAGVAAHTKGAGASYVINNGTIAVGSTVISVDGGTVNTTGFKAGDIITIADEPTAGKYVVKTGLTATAGDVTINYPGLTGAIVDGKAVTIGNSYAGNVGFHKAAIELVMRPPAQPYGGDAATDRMTMYDEKSGMSFEIAIYKGYGKVFFDITCFYAWKVWKPEFVATLLG